MHELRRLAYLEAMGIESYEARRPLPGAAASRRRPISVRPRTRKQTEIANAPVLPDLVALVQQPRSVPDDVPGDNARTARAGDAVPPPRAQAVPRFSLVTIVAGDWLWLEELGDRPLATVQVQLVQAMAYALQRSRGGPAAPAPARPDIVRFDWPIHNNRQLDLGEEAARAGLTAFIGRRLEQFGSRGMVLLGQSCANWVLPHTLDVVTVTTASSADILHTPSLKRQVWQDLLPLLRST